MTILACFETPRVKLAVEHMTLQGMKLTIEYPRGTYRTGTSPEGDRWKTLMKAHYGYIGEGMGVDKEHLDVYVGTHEDSKRVFIIRQLKPKDGSYDEDKVILAVNSPEEARQLFREHMGDEYFGGIRELPLDAFRALMKQHHGQSLTNDPEYLKIAGSQRERPRVKPGPAPQGERDWADSIVGTFTRKHPFESSSLQSARYNRKSRVLEVTFNSGATYHYKDIPHNLWRGLRRAKSKGKYLNKKVKKPGFSYKRVGRGKEASVKKFLTNALVQFPVSRKLIEAFANKKLHKAGIKKFKVKFYKSSSAILPGCFWTLRFLKKATPKMIGQVKPDKMSPAQMAADKLKGGLVGTHPRKGISLPKMNAGSQVATPTPTQAIKNVMPSKPKSLPKLGANEGAPPTKRPDPSPPRGGPPKGSLADRWGNLGRTQTVNRGNPRNTVISARQKQRMGYGVFAPAAPLIEGSQRVNRSLRDFNNAYQMVRRMGLRTGSPISFGALSVSPASVPKSTREAIEAGVRMVRSPSVPGLMRGAVDLTRNTMSGDHRLVRLPGGVRVPASLINPGAGVRMVRSPSVPGLMRGAVDLTRNTMSGDHRLVRLPGGVRVPASLLNSSR